VEDVESARLLLREARRVVAFTGAGISAESGVPTFRGAGGLWRNYDAQQLANPEAFDRAPQLVWEWYDFRRQIIAQAEPNAGHRALARLEQQAWHFALITQNVDGLHDRAGSRRILKLHGDIWTLRCAGCGREWRDLRAPLPELPPFCECGALLRPGVVWFGESLPPGIWAEAEQEASAADVFLAIGTSAVVYPAAGLIQIARRGGAVVLEINPEETPCSTVADYSLRGPSGEILPRLTRMSEAGP
jgi:NAD-dependent protein deacetylase/lipoamidase